jgi:Porin subfamily
MMRNCLLAIVIAALSAPPSMAQSSTSPQPGRSASSGKVLPMKRTAPVNSCAAYGPGFIKVEGTDTCVQIGGSISIGAGGSTGGRR